jgi:hypothetical protein
MRRRWAARDFGRNVTEPTIQSRPLLCDYHIRALRALKERCERIAVRRDVAVDLENEVLQNIPLKEKSLEIRGPNARNGHCSSDVNSRTIKNEIHDILMNDNAGVRAGAFAE